MITPQAANMYHQWRKEQKGPSYPLRTFQEASSSRHAHVLSESTGLPHIESAWLAGITLYANRLRVRTDLKAGPSMLFHWGACSPKPAHGRHINESRFLRWVQWCDNAEMWYGNTITGLRVVQGAAFSADSLFDLAVLHATRPFGGCYAAPEFRFVCGQEFYRGQALAHNVKHVPNRL